MYYSLVPEHTRGERREVFLKSLERTLKHCKVDFEGRCFVAVEEMELRRRCLPKDLGAIDLPLFHVVGKIFQVIGVLCVLQAVQSRNWNQAIRCECKQHFI